MKLDQKINRLEKLSKANTNVYKITFADDTNIILNRSDLFIKCITSTINIKNIIKNNCVNSNPEDEFFLQVCNALAILNNKLH